MASLLPPWHPRGRHAVSFIYTQLKNTHQGPSLNYWKLNNQAWLFPVAKPTLSIPINKPTNMPTGQQTVTIRAANISCPSSRILCLPLRCRLKVFISCHDAICNVSEAYGLALKSFQHRHEIVGPSGPWTAPLPISISTTDSSLTQPCSDSPTGSVWLMETIRMAA